MSAEIQENMAENNIPILIELPEIPLAESDIIYVWQSYVYYLAPPSTTNLELTTPANTRIIIEADINTGMTIRQIPINIIPVNTSMSITVDNPTNTYEPWYIFKSENSICLIDKVTKNPHSHHSTYDVNIYMKNTKTNEEYPPIHLENLRRIYDIIENSGKLYIAIHDYNELTININGQQNKTWHKILVIDTLTNTIIHTIAALNDTIYKIDIINDKLIVCQNWFGPRKVIWNINNLSADPQMITQSFRSYARYNSAAGTLIYQYNGWDGINPNFIESDDYQIVNTLNTPIAELKMVDIINEKYYIGLPEPLTKGSALNIYNLQTHELLNIDLFIFTPLDIYGKFRPYYISNNHIIFSTSNAIKIYKVEERPVSQRKNKYEYLMANLADEYSLPEHLVWEIKQNFGKELADYKLFEIVNDSKK